MTAETRRYLHTAYITKKICIILILIGYNQKWTEYQNLDMATLNIGHAKYVWYKANYNFYLTLMYIHNQTD